MPAPAALASLPKPLLFGLYGGLAGLAGALLLGQPVFWLLKPPPPAPPPPPPPQVAVTASPEVPVYQGGKNRLTVQVARERFDGPVTVRLADPPAGVSMAPVAVPAGKGEAEAEVAVGPAVPVGAVDLSLVAEATADGAAVTARAAARVRVDKVPPPVVDVVFALDVSGSMDWAIAGAQSGIQGFAAELDREGMDFRVAVLAFRNRTAGEEPELLRFGGDPFTRDLPAFRAQVGRLRAFGGGGEGESSLDAVVQAAELGFRKDSTRVLLLVTDEPPEVPDVRIRDVDEAVRAIRDSKIDQLHIVVRPQHRRIFERLQEPAPGRYFNLQQVNTGAAFASLLPDLSKQIVAAVAARPTARPEVAAAPPSPVVAVKAVQSDEAFAAGSDGQLVAAIAGWTAMIAAAVCLVLVGGQYHYLRSALPPAGPAVVAAAGGLLAGVVGGAAGQGLYLLAPGVAVLDVAFRVIGWALLGGLAGAGLAAFIPNLKAVHGLAGGAVGGAAGAVGYMLAAGLVGDFFGRLVGGLLLGFFIGLMVAIVEAAVRRAWLEVWHGPREKVLVNLGPEPVKVGGDSRACAVWARGAAPVALRYWVQGGRVVRGDGAMGAGAAVGDGDEQTVGSVRVVVRTGAGGRAVSPPPPPPPPPVEVRRPVAVPVDDAPPPPVTAKPPAVTVKPPPVKPPVPPGVKPPTPPAVKPPAPPAPPVSVKPPAPPKPAAPPAAADPNLCPHCKKSAHPGRPGTRYCMLTDQTY